MSKSTNGVKELAVYFNKIFVGNFAEKITKKRNFFADF